MCLAVPGKVIERGGNLARVDFQGNESASATAAITP